MNKLSDSLIFSFFVSLSMVTIDALYHLATETAVHINYVAVKFTVIFFVVFLVSYMVGKSLKDGIFSSVAGPVVFYFYYVFANPTLNRAVFKIDENVGYIFVHIAAMLLAYFSVYNYWLAKKGGKFMKSAAYAFVIALCVFGIYAGFKMGNSQLASHDEEQVVKVLSFQSSFHFFLAVFALSFISDFFIRHEELKTALFAICAGLIAFIWDKNPITSGVVLASAAALSFLGGFYIKQTK